MQRRRVDPVARRHGNRVADGAMDRRADRIPDRVRRVAGQRRQHGEHHVLACCAPGKIRLGRALHRPSFSDETTLRAYGSEETHTWIQKGADMAGIGTDGIRWIATDNNLRMDVSHCAGRSSLIARQGRASVPCNRDRRFGQYRSHRSSCRNRADLPGRGSLVPCGRGVRRLCGDAAGCASGVARIERSRLDCSGSAQMALRAARSRLCARAGSRTPPRGLRLSPALLSLRRGSHQLHRLRSAELPLLSRAESMAGPPARRSGPAIAGRIPDDIRSVASDGRGGRSASRAAIHNSRIEQSRPSGTVPPIFGRGRARKWLKSISIC